MFSIESFSRSKKQLVEGKFLILGMIKKNYAWQHEGPFRYKTYIPKIQI
jgi:hypothetical protein